MQWRNASFLKLPLVIEKLTVTPNDLYGLLRWSSARLVLVVLVVSTSGCSLMSNQGSLGQDTFSKKGRKTVSQAARDALFDVKTLVPLSAAVLFSFGDLDEEVSDWAREDTPIFGSAENAEDVSDILRAALGAETLAVIVATPSGDDPERGGTSRWKRLGVTALAVGLETGTTQSLKALTNRTRPSEEDNRSFPSGHSSNAFVTSTLSNRHLDAVDLAPWAKTSIRASNMVLASATAWARVEAGVHFPSDVLAGAALGTFFGSFIYDAFIGTSGPQRVQLMIGPSENGTRAQIFIPF